jgi:hypothetical protein
VTKKILFIITLLLALPAWARIGAINLPDLVKCSDFIAVVNVLKVEQPSGDEQLASFEPVEILKGDMTQGEQIYRGHLPICAKPSYQPGRYLLFLRRNEGQLIAAYHAYSIFEVKNNTLDWFVSRDSKSRKRASLKQAVADIRAFVK